jgi:tetratricopeptide (TPR) repeat protein/CHAT domain-containing protein
MKRVAEWCAVVVACLLVCVAVADLAHAAGGKTWDDAVRLFNEAVAAQQGGRFADAIGLFEEALAIVRELDQRSAEGVILGSLGNCWHSLSYYFRAIDFHEQALAIFVDIGDLAGEEKCLNNLGLCYEGLSNYERAIAYHAQSMAICRQISDRACEARSLNNLSLCYVGLSGYTRAVDLCERALAIFVDLDDRVGEAASLDNLGVCYRNLCDYGRAIDYHTRALGIYVDIGYRAGEAVSLNGLGNCYFALSNYMQALGYHEQALAINREIGNRVGEAQNLHNLGNCYYRFSDYARAINLYELATALFADIGARADEASCLGSLGNCYTSLSDDERAIDFHEQALAIFVDIGDRAGEAACLNNLGLCCESLLDYGRAINLFEQALIINREISRPASEADCLNNLGVCYRSMLDFGRAIDLYEESLAISREIGDRQGEADVLGNLGICHESLLEYERAAEYYRQSLTLAEESGSRETELKAYWSLGSTYRATSQLELAAQHYEAALAIVESIRGNVDEEALRESYLEGMRTLYEEYLELLLELDRSDETFLVAERLRARTFLDGLYQAGLTPAQLQRGEAGIDPTQDKTKPVMDYTALATAVDDGRQSLLPNEAVFEYMVTEDGIYLWVVTTGAISSPTFLPYPRQQLIEDVKALREAIETTDPDPDLIALQDKLGSLYTNLVASGLAQLGEGIDTLVFIPSGPLWYVPFAALPLRGQQDEEGNVPRMVERYTIAYLPSLASLTSLGGDEVVTPSRGVVALANPTLSQKQIDALGMTDTEYQKEGLEVAARDFSRCYVGQDETVYTESDAEEPRAYRSGNTSDVAIYACHGMFNPYFPLQSKLLLAPGDAFVTTEDDARNPDDGNYYAWEALLTDHRGVELVILAACETLLPSFRNLQDALGTLSGTDPKDVEPPPEKLERIVVGDEVVGLARAFLSSGAQSVLGTLWQANPEAITKLLVAMCEHHRDGMSWAQALCAAQRELIPMYANIWPWAPYQLIGRWR